MLRQKVMREREEREREEREREVTSDSRSSGSAMVGREGPAEGERRSLVPLSKEEYERQQR